MTKCAPVWRLLLSLFLAFSLAGCSQFKRSNVADEKDPHYLDGKRRLGMKDWEGAVQSFRRALQSNPNNAAAHFELGLIYEGRANKQAAAIYHFEEYMELRTNSPQATVVMEKVSYAKRALATQHAPAYVNRSVQAQLEKLLATNQIYATRIEQLEAQIARGPSYITNYVTNWYSLDQEEQRTRSMTWQTKAVQPPPAVAKAAVQPEEDEATNPSTDQKSPRTAAATENKAPAGNRATPAANAGAGARTQRNTDSPQTARRPEPQSSTTRARTTHTVRPGQTLAKIASLYGISVADLRKANPGSAKGAVAGQKLIIPEK